MRHAEAIMLDFYDKYIKHLYTQIEELELKKEEALKKLKEEQDLLTEYEQNVKVLEKHELRANDINYGGRNMTAKRKDKVKDVQVDIMVNIEVNLLEFIKH